MPNLTLFSLNLRKATVAFLRAQAQVTAIVAQRVYGEQLPSDKLFPFVKYGVSIETPQAYSGIVSSGISTTIDCFSKQSTTDECWQLSNVVASVLDGAVLTFSDQVGIFNLDVNVQQVQVVKDRDDVGAWHGVIRVRSLIGQPAD